MHTRYRIALVSLALLALSSAAPAAEASADPITITGNGQKQSAPFALDGGTYRVDWSLGNPTSRLAWITLESTTESSGPQSEFVHTTEKDPSGQTFLYKIQPGTYYLRAFAPAAWSVTFTPDPPIEPVKPIAAAAAPLTLADFAPGWGRHGFGLTINPDGSGAAEWRRYDAPLNTPESLMMGKATLRVDRVDGRTLYGTVLTTTGGILTLGPFQLTEYDYGIGELRGAAALGAAAIGAPEPQGSVEIVCGPRASDAPRWITRLYPCGA